MTGPEHIATRPGWTCACCLKDWPCDPAREAMAIETGGGTQLRLTAWAYFEAYALEVNTGTFVETYERFVAWA